MNTRTWLVLAALTVVVALGGGTTRAVRAQQPAVVADVILTNGKIITVDDRFSIAQAVAIRGERIVAVGTTQEIGRLAGTGTRRIDLRGRAVVPGFIDNHTHFSRAAETWQHEVRLDGIDTRQRALVKLRERARATPSGEWVYTLGGWTTDQFADDRRPFAREELDRVTSAHPVLLQSTFYRVYLNSRAIETLGLSEMTQPWIVRDPAGLPTGVIESPGVRMVASRVPAAPRSTLESSTQAIIGDFNRAGVTAVATDCSNAALETYHRLRQQGRLTIRVFCHVEGIDTPEKVAAVRLYRGDPYVDHIDLGERLSLVDDNNLEVAPNHRPGELEAWGRVAREVAKAGLPILIHANLEASIEAQLKQVEQLNRDYPVRHLRWAFAHLDHVNASQIERMKGLGMYAAVTARGPIQGALMRRIHGDRDVPALRMIHESGIHWGFGSDAALVAPYQPFFTLRWAVTGRMLGGMQVLSPEQTIDREDALIAHTRKNAYFVFRENDLGSIQSGKLADLLVLDQDYLTIPADQIKDITPVLTMVGGKVVYDAATQASTR